MSLGNLVAYGSDSSEDEKVEEEKPANKNIDAGVNGEKGVLHLSENQKLKNVDDIFVEHDEYDVLPSSISASLPKVVSELSQKGNLFEPNDVVDDVPIAVKPKNKERVKIMAPRLINDDGNEPPSKRLKKSQKGSGLFAVLPPPKHQTGKEANRLLLPNKLTNKSSPNKPMATKTVTQNEVLKETRLPKLPSSAVVDYGSDDEDNHQQIDFFSLTNNDEKDINVSHHFADVPNQSENVSHDTLVGPVLGPSVQTIDTTMEQYANNSLQQPVDTEPSVAACSDATPVYTDTGVLSVDAMKQLAGHRGHKFENVQVIDVNQDDILPDRNEWLTKSLSEEPVKRMSAKPKDGPTTQQRRKHQITFLAHQAKEREVELKSEWAEKRQTRRHTRSKYGF